MDAIQLHGCKVVEPVDRFRELIMPLVHRHVHREQLDPEDIAEFAVEERLNDYAYSEWQVFNLSSLSDSIEVGNFFLEHVVFRDREETCVVWLSDTQFLLCQTRRQDILETLHGWLGGTYIDVTFDARECYIVLNHVLFNSESVRLGGGFLDVLGRSNRISRCHVDSGSELSVPAMKRVVAEAPSSRLVTVDYAPLELCRVLAFHCNSNIELRADLCSTEDAASLLAKAMHLNRCPNKIHFMNPSLETMEILAPALETTTVIDKLSFHFQEFHFNLPDRHKLLMLFDAISRNRGTKTLNVNGCLPRAVKMYFWSSVLRSSTLQSIDASHLEWDYLEIPLSNTERQAHDLQLLALLGSNSVVTHIGYKPSNHDAHIMESQVLPLLKPHLIVESLRFYPNVEIRKKAISSLLQIQRLRFRPEFLYSLLKEYREMLLFSDSRGVKRGRQSGL